MKNKPHKIYLNIGADEELVGVSWCEDRINDDDLEYISVSSILARIEELKIELDNSDSSFSTVGIIQRLSELENLIK